MKRRKVITTFEALNVQKQLNRVKHEHARRLLESRLSSTYVESFIDLDALKVVIWVPYQSYVSEAVMEEINDMVLSIKREYPKIERVDAYGRDAIIEAFETGEFKQIPKSSIIQPELEGDKDAVQQIMIDGTDLIHHDKETKSKVEVFMDLYDNVLQKMNKAPAIEHGDIEAGEIRIIIETVNTPKNKE